MTAGPRAALWFFAGLTVVAAVVGVLSVADSEWDLAVIAAAGFVLSSRMTYRAARFDRD
ncbi:MAG TPA: hypothetical protein VI318_18130 [Baekduia sp.]